MKIKHKKNSITAIVLTCNEEKHLERCLKSLSGVVQQIVTVDSGSTDETIQICLKAGVDVYKNEWKNYSTQFNWALDNANILGDWILRIDADEYLSQELKNDIESSFGTVANDPSVSGVLFKRIMVFLDKPVRWGGCGNLYMLRLFRKGFGRCEERWMDEHIIIESGNVCKLKGELIDHNLNNIGWWINKHNNYATREAVDLLITEYRNNPRKCLMSEQAGRKRWLKEKIYSKLPISVRSLLYFLYRYIVLLGFLDGLSGLSFHFLQGFWYRFIVDMKVSEILDKSKRLNVNFESVVLAEYNFDIKNNARGD